MKIGIPHFKGTVVTARNSNYTINKAILDIMDGAVSFVNKTKDYKLKTEVKLKYNDEKLDKIEFKDNFHLGFENINCLNESNPFNMGHTRDGHKDDNETSEFGRGMKFSAIFLADEFNVYTRVQDKYYKIHFDFIEMKNKMDPIKSYESTEFREISIDEYKSKHNYDYGSTIILNKIREVHRKHEINRFASDIEKSIKDAYNKKLNLTIILLIMNYLL